MSASHRYNTRSKTAAAEAAANTHVNLAKLLTKKGDDAGAEHLYQEALRINPKHAVAHNNYGVLLKKKGDIAGAERHYQEALRIDPKCAWAHYNYGRLLLKKKGVEL